MSQQALFPFCHRLGSSMTASGMFMHASPLISPLFSRLSHPCSAKSMPGRLFRYRPRLSLRVRTFDDLRLREILFHTSQVPLRITPYVGPLHQVEVISKCVLAYSVRKCVDSAKLVGISARHRIPNEPMISMD